jgi:hypothetical protein
MSGASDTVNVVANTLSYVHLTISELFFYVEI